MTPRPGEMPREEEKRNGWTIVIGWLKQTFIPGFLFMGSSILFMVGYHQNPRLLLGCAAFLVLALAFDSYWIYMTRGSKMSKEVLLFAVCAAAIFFGSLVGISLHLQELFDYWPYYQKRHYTNVAPDELAASHSDASVLVFMEGARPDGSRYAGYYRYGSKYCVAPITIDATQIEGAEDTASNVVQYWAIGKNCCGGQQGFNCDDAQNENARSGLVMQKLTDDDTFLQGILSNDDMAYYEKAVLMSLTKFDLSSPKERMYVRFVQDIVKARTDYWWTAWWAWWKWQLMWLPAWMFAGVMAIVIGIGDPEDTSRYGAHVVDFKNSVLFRINHYV